MAVFFVDAGAGNDTNDGLDNIGVGLATATWTESTLTLTQSGHGYTFATGDLIFIESGTDVSQTGLYEVVSSTANNIVLAATSSLPGVQDGNDFSVYDLDSGDIVSSNGPWLTIDKAMDEVANTLTHAWIRSGTSYLETATINTAGVSATPIIFEGYTTTIGDEGQATIDGESGTRTDGIFAGISGALYYILRNFIIFGHSDAGVDMGTGDNMHLHNCNIHDNSGPGVRGDNSFQFVKCDIWNNVVGIDVDVFILCILCEIHANTGIGILCRTSATFVHCLIYDNTNGGSASSPIKIEVGTSGGVFLMGCTLDGDASGDGVTGTITLFHELFSSGAYTFYNNLFFDGDVGISRSEVGTVFGQYVDYNVFDDIVGAKRTNFPIGPNDIDDPTTLGLNADYTLAADSEAKAAGTDAGLLKNSASFIDMGALQRKEVGGLGLSGDASDYMEDQVSNYIFRTGYGFQPDNTYLAFYTSNPNDDNSGTEISGNGYIRQSLSFGEPINGTISNDAAITFPVATGSWGTITHFAIFDSESGGNMLVHSEVYPVFDINLNSQATIAVGVVNIIID